MSTRQQTDAAADGHGELIVGFMSAPHRLPPDQREFADTGQWAPASVGDFI